MRKSKDRFYIDTRPGRGAPFSPPSNDEDYGQWLSGRYESCQALHGERMTYFGMAQQVNHLIYSMVNERSQVMAFGINAGAFARFLEAMAEPVAAALVEKENSALPPAEKQQLISEIVLVEVISL